MLREVQVTRVVDVSPNLRRLTFTGADLAAGRMGEGFQRPAFNSSGFDDHVKFVFSPEHGDLPHIGTQEEKRFAWNPEVLEFTRDYTVRAWDPDALSFDIEVVRHDHGLASDWAYRASEGARLHVAGPKSCADLNRDIDWHLLVGDATALPAIARWLEEAPDDAHGHVIVEIPTPARSVGPGTSHWGDDRVASARRSSGGADSPARCCRSCPRPGGGSLGWLARR